MNTKKASLASHYSIEIMHHHDSSTQFHIKSGLETLSFQAVFQLWQHNLEFVQFYKKSLLDLCSTAFCWEHPALTKDLLDENYECTLQASAMLEQLPVNERAFKSHISLDADAVDFLNLGEDAKLVIPTKKLHQEIYNHFGKFLRHGDDEQINAVFQKTGQVITAELEKHPTIWLNTAGLGVIWLHIRMDTKPKYYKTKAYKNPEFLVAEN